MAEKRRVKQKNSRITISYRIRKVQKNLKIAAARIETTQFVKVPHVQMIEFVINQK